ncbi:copper/silver-translocating P-type ATPase [Lachnotalea glycerini]|uniref:Cd(2+)-exporting ATPase n=1 Tax=Lachnotalea glycerini TaxID=1763509 RepID=A0A318EPZ8_9FIRM|nr:cation-translocating P-type ATPase [Lachnotalea glycerini]PXV87733.1 copper/silver-translocating P-type ATPase [Lachnotalea glycerini]
MIELEKLLKLGGTKRDIIFLAVSAIALVISILDLVPLPVDAAWVAIILCGIPIIFEAMIGLVTSFDIKADVLVSIALIASVMIGEDFAAGEVAFIMQLGALLENLTVSKARAGIDKLIHLTPQTARRIIGETQQIIPAKDVKVGNLLRVLPGETIPVDGIITVGQTSINQAVMTGESLPVDKAAGDEVSSGTVNQFGSFDMKAVKVGEDSSIQRMVRLVQSADAGKAKIVGVADRWATWIVFFALSSAALTWLISGEMIRAVTILVVFCPCALVLATPTAIMASIGNATKYGFLVKEGDALERLSKVNTITFDKTGTVTYGSPKVTAIYSFLPEISLDEIYAYTASAEARSEHPLGKAVVRCYRSEKKSEPKTTEKFQMLPGRGVRAETYNKEIVAGNLELMSDLNIIIDKQQIAKATDHIEIGCTIIYLAIDRKMAGFLALADTLRKEAPEMIEQVMKAGVKTVLLTGDHESAAKHIASQLHIQEVYANCLPEDKLKFIDNCQRQNEPVCMIGDGINDAPALKKSFVGIAMGGIGSDAAVNAADIALVNDDIKEIPHLLNLSKKMMVTIHYNLTFSMILNFFAIILAMTGILNPVVGALVHNAGSVFVIINSALLLKWRK